jgi:hypothetical protein
MNESETDQDELQVAADEASDSFPPSDFDVGQRVYASDPDGVIFEATVRRKLYGATYYHVLSDRVSHDNVNDADSNSAPSWHYFVHYHGWSVQWDRWVTASEVFKLSEESKELSRRLQKEYKALQHEISSRRSGRTKRKGSVNADQFSVEWKPRMLQVYHEFEKAKKQAHSSEATSQSGSLAVAAAVDDDACKPKAKAKVESLTPASFDAEVVLREKRLTRMYKHGDKLRLPANLERILVDAWEIITQCSSVSSLPSRVTVKDSLDKYLESKGVHQHGVVSASDDVAPKPSSDIEVDNLQQWVDMRDGICQFFDEALPTRLLYPEELAQLYALHNNHKAAADGPLVYSETYGCEHLLRLLTRLPELLMDSMSEADARPIFGKLNDFVRFLEKDGSLFTLDYRSYNDAEVKEKTRLEDRKRKRSLEGNTGPAKAVKGGID